MSVKIIIERKFKEDPSPENFKDINELRIKAMQQGGYISGETLISIEDHRSVIVLSSWSSIEDWQKWLNSPERKKLENALLPYLEKPSKMNPLMIGSDAIKEAFEKFIHDSDVES